MIVKNCLTSGLKRRRFKNRMKFKTLNFDRGVFSIRAVCMDLAVSRVVSLLSV